MKFEEKYREFIRRWHARISDWTKKFIIVGGVLGFLWVAWLEHGGTLLKALYKIWKEQSKKLQPLRILSQFVSFFKIVWCLVI